MTGCRVRVCNDCCCGSERKHPGVDHAGIRARLRASLSGTAEVTQTPCLLACEESNVVVVSPSPQARRAGARPVWLGGVLDAAAVDVVVGWVRAGGPGHAEPPAALAAYVVPAPRLARLLGEDLDPGSDVVEATR